MSNKKHIRDILREALEIDKEFLTAQAIIRSDRSMNLTSILDEIRAVCGITVVGIQEPARAISKYVELTRCKIKFIQLATSAAEDVKKIIKGATKVKGVYSFRIKNVAKQQTN